MFEFSAGVNIIVGPNASGKTNLLEAVLVVARGSSYRSRDQELVEFNKPWARLDADTDGGHRTIKIVIEPKPAKSYELEGKSYQRLSLQHTIPAVLFEPNHLLLLHGAPEQRRTYLDDLLEQTVVGYGTLRRNYRRTLAQRNALLKRTHRPTNEELFPWNLRLSEQGAVIARRRSELCETINRQLSEVYRDISNTKSRTVLHYTPRLPVAAYESHMLHRLENDLATDIFRGFTATGPHREDFSVLLNDHNAEDTASRGEVRTLILALKIIELRVLEQARDQQPLLLLDDVFSELDGARRHALTSQLQNYQTFITTTDADIVQKNFAASAQVIPIARVN